MALGEFLSVAGIAFNAIGYWIDPKSKFLDVSKDKEFLEAYKEIFQKSFCDATNKQEKLTQFYLVGRYYAGIVESRIKRGSIVALCTSTSAFGFALFNSGTADYSKIWMVFLERLGLEKFPYTMPMHSNDPYALLLGVLTVVIAIMVRHGVFLSKAERDLFLELDDISKCLGKEVETVDEFVRQIDLSRSNGLLPTKKIQKR